MIHGTFFHHHILQQATLGKLICRDTFYIPSPNRATDALTSSTYLDIALIIPSVAMLVFYWRAIGLCGAAPARIIAPHFRMVGGVRVL